MSEAAAADPRRAALHAWVREALGDGCTLSAAAADASFRRYFRVHRGARTWIAMDAPPPHEDCRPYVQVAALLRAAGVHAPQVHAADLERGFLLLADLGTQSFLDVLTPDNADALYTDAITALVRWQAATRPGELPPYDAALLGRELDLFPEWYVGHALGLAFTAPERAAWQELRAALIARALAQPQVYVHRDYMVRNLMLADPNPGVIDFQDAVLGPVSYDLVSLCRDAFVSWDETHIARWVRLYWDQARAAGVPLPNTCAAFEDDLDWMGAQRHLKVLGIFARLAHRDGKPRYLTEAPRFVGYLKAAAAHTPGLAPLGSLLDGLHARAGRAAP